MECIQLVGMSPTEFENMIFESVQRHFDEIKKLFSSTASSNDLMTREEVASMLKIDLSTLYVWTKNGKLVSYGIGSRVYYKRAEVENAIVKLN